MHIYHNHYKKFFTFFLHCNIKIFDYKKIESDFYKNKKPSQLVDTDVNKKLVSKKEPYGKNNSLI